MKGTNYQQLVFEAERFPKNWKVSAARQDEQWSRRVNKLRSRRLIMRRTSVSVFTRSKLPSTGRTWKKKKKNDRNEVTVADRFKSNFSSCRTGASRQKPVKESVSINDRWKQKLDAERSAMNIHSPSENLIAARFRWPWLQVSKKRNDEGNTEGLASAITRRDITPPPTPVNVWSFRMHIHTYISAYVSAVWTFTATKYPSVEGEPC